MKINVNFIKVQLIISAFFFVTVALIGCKPTNGDNQEPESTAISSPEPDPQPIEYTFYTDNLGYENSGISIYKWYQDDVDKLDLQDTVTRNKAVLKYGAYINETIANLKRSLTDDNTKEYLEPYFNNMTQNNYDLEYLYHNGGGDSIWHTFYNVYYTGSYIYTDLIKACNNRNEGLEFYDDFLIISNEAYDKSSDLGLNSDMSDTYYECIREASSRGGFGTLNMTADDIRYDIAANNCGEIVKEFKRILEIATQNLNEQKNLKLTLDQVIQLVNITISGRSMQNLNDKLRFPKENIICYYLEQDLSDARRTLLN